MNETQQLLDKTVLTTVRAIIVRDLNLSGPQPTDRELATLRSIACSEAASFGTRLIAERALTWIAAEMLSEMEGELDSVPPSS